MKPVRRLREPFVEVPCSTGGSTKVPWRVHEASPRRTRAGNDLLNNDKTPRDLLDRAGITRKLAKKVSFPQLISLSRERGDTTHL